MISIIMTVLIFLLTGFVLLFAISGYFARGNTEARGYYLLAGAVSVLVAVLGFLL